MRLFLVGIAFVLAAAPVLAQPPAARNHALILVGLPGDAEHETLFADIAQQWRTWLTDSLGFAGDDVRVLFGRSGKEGLARGAADRATIEREVADLKAALHTEDRLWVFFLGHGDYDGERARFHLPGSDFRNDELGKLFAGIDCREQVFWMTMSASGWFLKSLSARGRIVITATAADDEFNETEFPQALADVTKLPVDQLDANKDGKVSLIELYRRVVKEVEARFAADKRIPTEHAQLDDNGDGKGTEEPVVDDEPNKKPTADGALAARTIVPWRTQPRNR
jgi:hypothetical protein